MQGYSGTYAFNGTEILKPTTHRWAEMETIGLDGNGRPIYPAVTEIELSWQLISVSDLKTLIDFSKASQTGTVVSDLPRWGDSGYLFYSFSGTFVNRPTVGTYFSEYVQDVSLVISNARTE